ncbi:hypothetical protein CDAR_594131 [Caerostris darwini]|uniref:Uncharacterized protein n=1 Tax=Caerostris darwini TaxID=1538125 RepID=A0AAV4RJR6_9ARAC|nr:hypothetical protein CDAR_594131 [Caerostris darwini]
MTFGSRASPLYYERTTSLLFEIPPADLGEGGGRLFHGSSREPRSECPEGRGSGQNRNPNRELLSRRESPLPERLAQQQTTVECVKRSLSCIHTPETPPHAESG